MRIAVSKRPRRLLLGFGAVLATAGTGCGTPGPELIVEAISGVGALISELYTRPSGFEWWDSDIEGAGQGNGKITLVNGNALIAVGGGCGVYGWGPCNASLTGSRIDITLPSRNTAGHPPIKYGLERVAGAIRLDDGAGGVLLSIQPTSDGGAMINGRTGAFIATATKADRGIRVSNWDNAYLGAVDSAIAPEIAALALGGVMDTSGDPDIADHAIVVASALTWLN